MHFTVFFVLWLAITAMTVSVLDKVRRWDVQPRERGRHRKLKRSMVLLITLEIVLFLYVGITMAADGNEKVIREMQEEQRAREQAMAEYQELEPMSTPLASYPAVDVEQLQADLDAALLLNESLSSVVEENTVLQQRLEDYQWLDTLFVSKGEFEVTSYCSCSICCDKWAKDRPVVSGKTLVKTASGEWAEEGLTVSADWSVFPEGSYIYIEGFGVRRVQDNGGSIKGNKLDLYMTDHQAALVNGRQHLQVWLISTPDDAGN